jgi:phosphoglycolate phosphatase-like HAD superfamily hydrolase
MKQYTTYLFDFDYTLADSSRGIVMCYQTVLKRHGFNDVSDDRIKSTIGKTLEDSFSIMTGITDHDTLMGMRKEYVAVADKIMTDNTRLFPETVEVLTALKQSGAKVGIISTKYRYRIKECLNRHMPDNALDLIVGGEDVSVAKPHPEGVLFALSHLNSSAAETLYIGDSTVDAETAEAARVDFAAVLNGVTTTEELQKYPHVAIMPDLRGLL